MPDTINTAFDIFTVQTQCRGPTGWHLHHLPGDPKKGIYLHLKSPVTRSKLIYWIFDRVTLLWSCNDTLFFGSPGYEELLCHYESYVHTQSNNHYKRGSFRLRAIFQLFFRIGGQNVSFSGLHIFIAFGLRVRIGGHHRYI